MQVDTELDALVEEMFEVRTDEGGELTRRVQAE